MRKLNGLYLTIKTILIAAFVWPTCTTADDLHDITGGTTGSYKISTVVCTPVLSAVITNDECGIGIGTIDLTSSPAGNTYAWSNGATTEDLINLNAGTYIVTVTGTNGCSVTDTFSISSTSNDFNVSGVTVDNTSCTGQNGSINITVTPGGSYSFLWSNGMITEDIQSLNAGSYDVTITDANSCSVTESFDIGSNVVVPTISSIIENENCGNSDGSINITVTGTNTFLWSNGTTSEDLYNLQAGVYSVTITSSAGCISSDTFNIIDSANSFSVSAASSDNTSCLSPTGSIDLTVIPGGDYTFIWSNGMTTEDIHSVSEGLYGVTISNNSSCSISASFSVGINMVIPIIESSQTNETCGGNNGEIDITATPAGASFQWSTGAITEDINNLTAGIYTITVTEPNGCAVSDTLEILNSNLNFSISAIVTNSTSCTIANGSVDLEIVPADTYTFIWSNGSLMEDLFNLDTGTYEVTVTDKFNCSATASYAIESNTSIPIVTETIMPASCGQSNGHILLDVIPSTGISFLWSHGFTGKDLTDVPGGVYSVIITNSDGCSSTLTFTLEDPTTNPLLSEIITSTTCGDENGSIQLSVSPSTGNTFTWSTGEVTEDLENIQPGTYTVTVYDVNGCTSTGTYSVPGSSPVELSINADLTSMIQSGIVKCSLELNVPLAAIDSIMWSPVNLMSCHGPLCVEQELMITDRTEVFLIARDTNGCLGTAYLLLDLEKSFKVYIPNVFTPNNDDSNDKFTIYANKEIEEVVILQIFDRLGNMVFENSTFPPNEPDYGWDGMFSNQLLKPAVFAYRAVVKDKKGDDHYYKGNVTLVR